MRVAQIAPLYESVPPFQYGGTERVVSYLTEELIKQGHDVYLFASGDSKTKAHLVPTYKRSLRLHGEDSQGLIPHLLMVEKVRQMADEFDVLHFHIDHMHYPLLRTIETPSVTTIHGRLDLPSLIPLYREYSEVSVISISNNQRDPLPWLNWRGTVYHGLPKDLYTYNATPRRPYAAFVGRISPEKGPDKAIEIARRAGIPLKMAAKVDEVDRRYFEKIVKPLLDSSPEVEFVGEIGDEVKNQFLGDASLLIFPIDWPEPFGLVMIESLACGTPVVAFRKGSVPEVIRNGVTGFVVDSVEEAVKATERISQISRLDCRKEFESRFTVERMARNYLQIYKNLTAEPRTYQRQSAWKTSFSTTTRST